MAFTDQEIVIFEDGTILTRIEQLKRSQLLKAKAKISTIKYRRR